MPTGAETVLRLIIAAALWLMPGPLLAAEPLAHFPFDAVGDATSAAQGEPVLAVHSPYRPIEQVAGVEGRALRLDGYSTWLEGDGASALAGPEFTVELWLAVAHYPVETAAIVTRQDFPERGVRLAINPWGHLAATVTTESGPVTALQDEASAKGRWLHVAMTFDPQGGLALFLDGQRVARASSDGGDFLPAADAPLVVGRAPGAGERRDTFPLGVVNGLIDELRIYDRALDAAEITERARDVEPAAAADTAVPETRFADDPARPRYHAMPTTGWTNEPHGLIHDGERFRLFYQANPNGPFWSRIRWGQLTSEDLVHWVQRPPALVPEPGFDEVGIWVGNTFFDREGRLRAVYTGVNGVKAAIGLATAGDRYVFDKHPANPLIPDSPPGFKDFRDPYVWWEEDGWSMLVGAGTLPPDERGVALLYRSNDLLDWRFESILDTGQATPEGVYWEVPFLVPIDEAGHALFVTTVEDQALARGLYWLGDWNGERFSPTTGRPRYFDLFHRLLSPTFARHPDGRLIAIGIVAGTQELETRLERGWVHTFSLPREVRACPEAGLCQSPLAELQALRGERQALAAAELSEQATVLDLGPVPGEQMELVLEIDPAEATELVLELRATPDLAERSIVRLWPHTGQAELDLSEASLSEDLGRGYFEGFLTPVAEGERMTVRVFVDHSAIDVFVNDTDAFSFRTFPSRADATRARLSANGGPARLLGGDAWAMQAAPITEQPSAATRNR